jgi:hypothetical protein
MARHLFPGWGDDLDDTDFACALAALGCMPFLNPVNGFPTGNYNTIAQRLIEEWLDEHLREKPVTQWLPPLGPDMYPVAPEASVLAQAWKKIAPRAHVARLSHPPIGVRFECYINSAAEAPMTSIHDILAFAPHVSSVFWPTDTGQIPTTWDWPLTVGFFDDDASRALRDTLSGSYHAQLRRHVSVMEAEQDVTLLLLPGTLEQSLSLPPPPSYVSIHTVVALGGADGTVGMVQLLDVLRQRMRAAAAAVLGVPEAARQAWLTELTAELGHNTPLDVALFLSGRGDPRSRPLVIGQAGAFRSAQLSEQVRRVTRRIAATTRLGSPSVNALLFSRSFSLDPTLITRGPDLLTIGPDLVAAVDERLALLPFDSEGGDATNLLATFEVARNAEAERPGEPRFFQANIFVAESGENKTSSYAVAGRVHRAHVSIGPPREDTAVADAPFPELEDEPGGHELDVHWVELTWGARGRPRAPQTARLHLPYRGRSNTVPFSFTPAEGLVEYVARLVVVHRGRVLQTALARVPVGAMSERAAGVRIQVESMIRTFEAAGLPGRGFDVAMVLNDTPEGHPLVAAIHDGSAAALPIGGDIDTLSRQIGRALDRYADAQDEGADLSLEDPRVLLRTLARKGNLLRGALRACETAGEYTRASRIQLISLKPDAVLPVELCYEGPAPNDDATVCPHAAEALGKQMDRCDPRCHGPTNEIICPFAFWALSKRIERHLPAVEVQREMGGVEYRALRNEEIQQWRTPLSLGASVLWAVHVRADVGGEGTIAKCEESLRQLFEDKVHRVRTWQDWRTAVSGRRPSMLALVAHIDQDEDDDVFLEIENEEKLTVAEIETEHVCITAPPGPLVVLLGCSTADQTLAPFTVISRFREKQAAIVVGTLGKVIGRHAALTAVTLLAELRAFSQRIGETPTSFADAFLTIRRKLMAEGKTMALGLIAIGDANWKLQRL